MEQQSIRKTYKYKLKPTPEQERTLERTLMLCRHVYNAAISERREAWRMRGVSCHLLPAEGGIAWHQRGDARIRRGQCPGLAGCGTARGPRLSGILPSRPGRARRRAIRASMAATATTASPIRRWASMVARRWMTVSSVLSKIGRIPIRLHRPLEGTPKTVTISREADGWYVCFSCAEVPMQPLPADWTGDRHRPRH